MKEKTDAMLVALTNNDFALVGKIQGEIQHINDKLLGQAKLREEEEERGGGGGGGGGRGGGGGTWAWPDEVTNTKVRGPVPVPLGTAYPRFSDGARVVHVQTRKKGKIDGPYGDDQREQELRRKDPTVYHYRVQYDTGTYEPHVSQDNLYQYPGLD